MTRASGAALNKLAGLTALVTGASQGIGAAVARRLASEGAAVVLGHEPRRDCANDAANVADAITADGGRAVAVPADLGEPDQIAELADRASAWTGSLDIVIANAAVQEQSPWQEISVAQWDRVHAVNLRGTFLLAQRTVARLAQSTAPSFTAVTSVMVDTGRPGAVHYSASKAGIIGLVRSLAREVGPAGIRVNAVMPGAIRTERQAWLPLSAPSEQAIVDRQALRRRGGPDDVTGAFVFLASPDSAFITGQIITVDGGWVMR